VEETMKKQSKILFNSFLIIISVCIYIIIGNYRENRFSSMNSRQMINEYTHKNQDLILTIGIIYEGVYYTLVFNKYGNIPNNEIYTYEIGSITKTFTTALLCKALEESKISLDDNISKYIQLNDKKYHYPTIKQLATHTSGYENYPADLFLMDILISFFRKNEFIATYSGARLLKDIAGTKLSNKEYKYKYSDFGMSVLGYILGEIYKNNYKTVMEIFILQELDLKHTNFIKMPNDDVRLAAEGLTSNIEDMLKYTKIQMDNDLPYLRASRQDDYDVMINNFYNSGLAWFINKENNFIWHGGTTHHFNSFIGFDNKMAVIVLANVPDKKYINAKRIGMKITEELYKGTFVIFE
jgi:CubicO group peptidase (beta-lactamase class C family)